MPLGRKNDRRKAVNSGGVATSDGLLSEVGGCIGLLETCRGRKVPVVTFFSRIDPVKSGS